MNRKSKVATSKSNLVLYKDFLIPEFQRTLEKMGVKFEDGPGLPGDGHMDKTNVSVSAGAGTSTSTSKENGANRMDGARAGTSTSTSKENGADGMGGAGAGAGCIDMQSEEKMAEEKSKRAIAEFQKIMHDFPDTYRDYDFTAPTVVPTILNVVASVSLGINLDLEQVQRKIANVELDPLSIATCVVRIKNPRSTCTVFESGTLTLQCMHSIDDCKLAARKFVGLIKKAGFKLPEDRKPGYSIANITAKTTLPWPMNLRELNAIKLQKKGDKFSYEPEIFPGLIWTSKTPKCKTAIFGNGDVLYTGMTSESDLEYIHKAVFVFGRLMGN